MSRKRLVVLTGAGISAESGLKTFRDSDGLWEGHNIEDVATPRAWKKNPALVLEFYNARRRALLQATPNEAHLALAELEKELEVHIITQNVDDLHERAGSTRVLHLHGELRKMRSERNEAMVYPIEGDILIGDFADDGAQLRPDIVWFEEPVPLIETAAAWAASADIFAIIGTSLAVYPAAGLVHYTQAQIPKFIVDRRVPATGRIPNLHAIEAPATEGVTQMAVLIKELLKGQN